MATLNYFDLKEHIECAAFIDGEAFFAVADGAVHFPILGKAVEAHDSLLCATPERGGKAMLTGGEDGRVLRVTTEGWKQIAEVNGKWVDVIASGPNGSVAVAAGRSVFFVVEGKARQFDFERAVEGLAFMPKGLRLACARYNGVTLVWGAAKTPPQDLHWDGAHIGVLPSPDGRYIVSSMAENALHGWRLDAKKAQDAHMRMSGYPAKPKSLSWSTKGRWLASSGAPAAICWPFSAKEGPQGKAPRELGTRRDSLVLQVCWHPKVDVLAMGYADGMVALVRINDGAENVMRESGEAPISTLAWDDNGDRLAYGSEAGEAGIITL